VSSIATVVVASSLVTSAVSPAPAGAAAIPRPEGAGAPVAASGTATGGSGKPGAPSQEAVIFKANGTGADAA
jgi:hypothetical protein